MLCESASPNSEKNHLKEAIFLQFIIQKFTHLYFLEEAVDIEAKVHSYVQHRQKNRPEKMYWHPMDY